MGMPCEVNSILKLTLSQGYPNQLSISAKHKAYKEGYRIIPVDVPILLVNEDWISYADIIIEKLIWEKSQTVVFFRINQIYSLPFVVKE